MDPSIDYSALPLRDIHLPEPVSWWPPAPGWWVLLAFGLAVLVFALYRRHRERGRRAALAAIDRIVADLRAGADPAESLREMSIVLRRFAMSVAADGEARMVPGLVGRSWLEYLDRHGGGEAFRRGPGRLLADAPYRPGGVARDDALEAALVVSAFVRAAQLAPSRGSRVFAVALRGLVPHKAGG
ncbi:MAG: DUF4381 domain-containing protein [Gammaproteobacteria bacterium]|nr:DUF4381 domain-containing protein [Gammaproteobacteria bacterium]